MDYCYSGFPRRPRALEISAALEFVWFPDAFPTSEFLSILFLLSGTSFPHEHTISTFMLLGLKPRTSVTQYLRPPHSSPNIPQRLWLHPAHLALPPT